jgi:hypothetical protein
LRFVGFSIDLNFPLILLPLFVWSVFAFLIFTVDFRKIVSTNFSVKFEPNEKLAIEFRISQINFSLFEKESSNGENKRVPAFFICLVPFYQNK